MQIPITIKKQLFPIQKVEELFGEEVPFEIETYEADWENAKTGGFFDLSCWGVIEISGPDALDYLQRMSSANVKSLEVQSSTPGTFLTGKGTLVAMGTFWRPDSQRFLFTVSPNLIEKTLAHLEMFHFQEKLEIKNRTSDLAVIGLWKVPSSVLESSWHETRVPDLSYLVVNRIELEPKLLELSRKKLPFLGMHVFHYLRVRAGLPWMGWEVSEADLVLEAGLEDFVARNKGCYPGQEVVERIFTYGQVNRKLIRVEWEGIEGTGTSSPIEDEIKGPEGKGIGVVKSLIEEPGRLTRGFGLAFVRKEFWENRDELQTVSGLRVKLVPIRAEE